MLKKLRLFCLTVAFVLLLAVQTNAQPTIDVGTNGGTTTFNQGSVVVISGQLSDNGTPLPNNSVMVQVKSETDNSPIFLSDAITDANGYYCAVFTLPDSISNGTYRINVSSGPASSSTTFGVPATTKSLDYVGSGYNTSGSTSDQVDVVPADTNQFALIFSSNVNYFFSKKYESYTVGLNDSNQDSIALYQGIVTGGTPIAADVVLVDNDRQGNAAYSYYVGNQLQSEKRKKVIIVKPKQQLAPNTAYAVLISKDLSANNGNTLGADQTVTFRTAADGSVLSSIATLTSDTYTVSTAGTITNVSPSTSKATFLAALKKVENNQTWNTEGIHDPVISGDKLVVTAQDGTTKVTYTVTVNTAATNSPGGGGVGGGGTTPPSNPLATPAEQIGKIVNNNGIAKLEVDAPKTLDILKNTNQPTLAIDISAMAGTAAKGSSVQLPAQVINAVSAANKAIIIQYGDLAISIPPTALVQGKDMVLSIAQVSNQAVPAAPQQAKNTGIYEFSAQIGSEQTHNFQQDITVTLPIPPGVANPDKIGVYYLNESAKKWEYVGGWVIDGKLVFKTGHFSKYMAAESTMTFADISNHWGRVTIEVMAARHIVSGISDTRFAPERNITRAEFAALLVKALGLNASAKTNPFSDVSANAWYAQAISEAAAAGIISGSDGKFRPIDRVTREEMALMIMKAYGIRGGKAENLLALSFADKAAVSPWASDAVKGASQLGIIKGMPGGRFAPKANATRAEAAVMLKLFMDKLGV